MSDELFRRMAERLTKNQDYIAYLIRLIAEQNDQSWEAVAQRFQMTPRDLTEVALCRRPHGKQLPVGALEIAAVVKVDLHQLVSLLRYGEALEALHSSRDSSGNDQSLMAARDRDDEE
jgi:hypothetical protein